MAGGREGDREGRLASFSAKAVQNYRDLQSSMFLGNPSFHSIDVIFWKGRDPRNPNLPDQNSPIWTLHSRGQYKNPKGLHPKSPRRSTTSPTLNGQSRRGYKEVADLRSRTSFSLLTGEGSARRFRISSSRVHPSTLSTLLTMIQKLDI